MKSTQIALLAFSALCTAQLQGLPNCAKPCASSLPPNCNLDVKCICSDQSWITGISCCIKNSCPASDQQKTLQVAVQLCDTVKVTLPSAASCPASAGPSGASTAAVAGQGTASSASNAASGGQNTASSAMSNMSNTATTSATGQSQALLDASIGSTQIWCLLHYDVSIADISLPGSSSGTSTPSTATSSTSAQAATGAAQVLGSNVGAVGAAVAALALL